MSVSEVSEVSEEYQSLLKAIGHNDDYIKSEALWLDSNKKNVQERIVQNLKILKDFLDTI